MTVVDFEKILAGGDLRSIGKSKEVVSLIKTKSDFDKLFKCLHHKDRLIVMRAADAIEKITINNPAFLQTHKKELLDLLLTATNKELKWHISLLVSRLQLSKADLGFAWQLIAEWVLDKKNSRIVRVNAIQSLFELMKQNIDYISVFELIIKEVNKENIPSINARLKKLKADLSGLLKE